MDCSEYQGYRCPNSMPWNLPWRPEAQTSPNNLTIKCGVPRIFFGSLLIYVVPPSCLPVCDKYLCPFWGTRDWSAEIEGAMAREGERRPWRTPEVMLHYINVNTKNQSSLLCIAPTRAVSITCPDLCKLWERNGKLDVQAKHGTITQL